VRAWWVVLATVLASILAPPAGAADLDDDPAFLSIGGGYYDTYRRRDTAIEGRFEYRDNHRFWLFKPFVGAMADTDNAFFIYAGVRIDLFFGDRWVVTPSFAPGYYDKGDGFNLGHHIEFRSQLEIAYRFDNRTRLGFGYGHISNAHLSKQNPGVESAFVMLSIPLWE
jgi:lipid A 3-O-deacylase